jgi:hypothetical protein
MKRISTGWTKTENLFELAGAVVFLEHRILKAIEEVGS